MQQPTKIANYMKSIKYLFIERMDAYERPGIGLCETTLPYIDNTKFDIINDLIWFVYVKYEEPWCRLYANPGYALEKKTNLK